MMEVFLSRTLVVLSIVIYGSTAMNPRLDAWLKSCQEKTGANDEDYRLIKSRKIPLSFEGVCMVECIFEKLHIIDNGQFNRRGFVITFSPVVRGDLRKLSKLKEVAANCDEEIKIIDSKENCSTTKLALDCFSRNKDKLDLSKKS